MYPNTPCSTYNDYDIYNKELERLMEDLKKLEKINNSFLFHITIGGAMEEVYNFEPDTILKYPDQWEQLFPYHVREFAKMGNKVLCYIISPNETFSIIEEKFKEPLFISMCPDFDFVKKDNSYVSNKYDCQINIYYTMMPHIDPKNNLKHKNIIKNFQNNMKMEYINKFKQTEYDIIFTNKFYKTLKKVINKIDSIDGIVSCFSFAVFNINTYYGRMSNYPLFNEIINCFNLSNKQILAEWTFSYNCYSVYDYFRQKIITYICNVKDTQIMIGEDDFGLCFEII
jgi:hypothetical protein